MDSLANLKIASIIIAGLFALIPSIYNFKDEHGNTTRRGKIILGIAVAGVVIAAVAQFLDSKEQNEARKKSEMESLQATQRVEKIINDLNRSLQTISSFEVYFSGNEISLEDKSFDEYRIKIDKAIENHINKTFRERMHDKNIRSTGYTLDEGKRRPTSIEIHKDSIYSPMSKNINLGIRAMPLCYNFTLFRTPIEPSQFQPGYHGAGNEGDLVFSSYFSKDMSLNKDLETNKFSISGSIEFEKKLWSDKSGKIISILDLAGAQIFFDACTFGSAFKITKKNAIEPLPSADLKFSPGSMAFRIGARSFWIKKESWVKHSGVLRPYWEYRFPADLDALWK